MAESKSPILLWPEGAPGALGKKPQDVPTLTPYPADPLMASGAAVVVCPGGGYGALAPHEGEPYAIWLNQQGISAFVLKYRLGTNGYRHPAMLNDAARAVRIVREKASAWGIDPHRIGIIGSSAGGHLVSTLVTHFDAGNPKAVDPIEHQSSRPDFAILCYPVITMGPGTHAGSQGNLLGSKPSTELIELLSNEKQVRDDTPPCFVWHTAEDASVPVSNSLAFAAALNAHHVPFDLHIYEKGRHGIGLGKSSSNPARLHPWTDDLRYWLNERGLLKP
jgi:acetyl esterase/lipase